MTDTRFFSEDIYLHLPSKTNPKVILAVGSSEVAKHAFQLYNPFSFKAKTFKRIIQFLFVNLNSIMLKCMQIKSHKKSDFISHLENKLNTKLTVSIYNATAKDKVVLQLQSNNKIYGYLKFPINNLGNFHINNEIHAIASLYKKGVCKPCLLVDSYNETPYFIISELKGKIETPTNEAIENLLINFKKKRKQKLVEHQRIQNLYKDLEVLKLNTYTTKIDNILKQSTAFYYEAFEHGDFAPWNIIKTNEGIVPFDFEYFVEDGIEYFDLIKYHFQIGRLLKKKKPIALCEYIFNEIKTPEIKQLLSLFLIKEIIILKKSKESYPFQDSMLNYICE